MDRPDTWIEALYERLLLRASDEVGRKEKANRLRLGTATPASLVDEILRSDEFRANIGRFLETLGEVPFTNNVSQFDEIGLLVRDMVNRSAPRYVVDVGARGRDRSNSWDLLRHFGWRGLLVEANPALRPSIERSFSGLDYQLVTCAVSDYSGQAEFTIGSNDDVSSLNADLAGNWGATRGRISVPVRRLGDILQSAGAPVTFGLLSLDIEGEDIKVLNDLMRNSPYRARYIIFEASYDFSTESLADLPVCAELVDGYEMIGQTRANLLLRKKDNPDDTETTA